MLLNYLRHALRLLARNPFFTAINVLGLAVGFAAFFILWQYTNTELSTDLHIKDHERMGRVGCYWRWKEDVSIGQMTCGAIPVAIMSKVSADYPQIVDYTTVVDGRILMNTERQRFVFSSINRQGNRVTFKENRTILADSNLFDFFGINLILGDRKTALNKPNTVALSQSTALRYFGNQNPLYQTLNVNDTTTVSVTGVFKDFDRSTHLSFDVVLSNAGMQQIMDSPRRQWGVCYFKLGPEGDFKKLEETLRLKGESYWLEEFEDWSTSEAETFVQPLAEIAFGAHYWGDFFWPKSRFTLYSLSAASFLVLLMAWINYINLTISRTIRRLKEVATRKVSGAKSIDLINQFVIESLLIHLLAIGASLTIIQLLRWPFAEFLQFQLPELGEIPATVWLVFILISMTGVLATSLYPALMSISYKPRSLFGLSELEAGRPLSALLTTLQYASAIALIVWVSVVFSQLDFVLNRQVGVKKENIVVFEVPSTGSDQFKSRLNSFMNQIKNRFPATYGQTLIGDEYHWRIRMKSARQRDYFQVDSNGGVDETFIPFFGIKLLAGRNFVSDDRPDVILVSRYTALRLGYSDPAEAVGARVLMEEGNFKELEIVGVLEDYELHPLVNYVENTGHPNMSREDGICLTYRSGNFRGMTPEKVAVSLNGNFQEEIAWIEQLFLTSFPESTFHWNPMGDFINKSYNEEKILSRQVGLLATLALGMSCLGLLGMVSSKAEEKIKEIGIRKILGASLTQLCSLLLQSTAWQVISATLIGMPIAWYLGQQYLEKYSQRIELQWWHFALPLAILLMIMFGVVSSVLFKAARNNPVEALKCEN